MEIRASRDYYLILQVQMSEIQPHLIWLEGWYTRVFEDFSKVL